MLAFGMDMTAIVHQPERETVKMLFSSLAQSFAMGYEDDLGSDFFRIGICPDGWPCRFGIAIGSGGPYPPRPNFASD